VVSGSGSGVWVYLVVEAMSRPTTRTGTKYGNNAVLDVQSIQLVRMMKKCSRSCPAFILCPLMPLSIQPTEAVKRICLVNCGDERLRVAYYKMFVGGQDGVVQMLQTSILEYGDLLKKSGDLTNKERLHSIERMNMMLERLHKMMTKSSNSDGTGNARKSQSVDEEMDEVILIASGNDAKPDPESLEHSPMLDDLIKHEPMNPYMPKLKKEPVEVDLGKELLDKFFPQDE